MTADFRRGDTVVIVAPENPQLDGTRATVLAPTEWNNLPGHPARGYLLDAPAAATGRFRALDTEVVAAPDSTQAARAMGYTGDSCVTCGSVRMVMDGRCAKCLECGSTAGGCS